jgi:integrase
VSAGHWRVRGTKIELRAYTGRDPMTGRKRYETKSIPTVGKKAADAELARFVASLGLGVGAEGTFGELVDRWVSTASPSWSPAGLVTVRRTVDYYLGPLLPVKLAKLRTSDLDAFYGSLRAHGGRCQAEERCERKPCPHGRALASSTVNRIHDGVRSALEQAVTWEWLPVNPAVKATPGPLDEAEIRPPATEEVIAILEAAEADSLEFATFLVLAATTSRRRGELVALQWPDVDLEGGELRIEYVISVGADGQLVRRRKTIRARKGRPTKIALDAATTEALAAHRKRMVERALALGTKLRPDAYVFSHEDDCSEPWRPDFVSLKFRRLRTKLGLEEIRLHDLRHFVVTTLLGAGVDQRTIMGRSGHSSLASLGRYGHFLEVRDRAAADLLGKLLERRDGGGPGPDGDAHVIPFRRPS